MPSKHSKSSLGKSKRSVIHDIFPKILQNDIFNYSDSIITGIFYEGWPPLPRIYENDQINNIKQMMQTETERVVSTRELDDLLRYEMARVVYGSNFIERVGLELDETLKLSLKIFRGEMLENANDMNSSHLEVLNHANAFLHLFNYFIIQEEPLSETLVKETHSILCHSLSAADAGVLSSKTWGGVYRSISANEKAFVGAYEFSKPSEIPKAMKSLVLNLQSDIESLIKTTDVNLQPEINIWQLAAKYCERFVQIHPFRDGNGRMCRLILNAILIRFAGIPIAIGMNESERDNYLSCAQESSRVGGNPTMLGNIIGGNAMDTLAKWKMNLEKLRKYMTFKGLES